MSELRVAFAGHNRLEDLGELETISQQLAAAFALLGVTTGVLSTGLAEGADVIAVIAWTSSGSGVVHAVLPYLDDCVPEPISALVKSVTNLDGMSTERAGRNAHLTQTRWIIEDADLLVAVWSGESARGAGGTADAVQIALQRGVPVLWVQPGRDGGPRVIIPAALDPDFGFLEFLERLKHEPAELLAAATAEGLADVLSGAATTPRSSQPRARSRFNVGGHWDRLLDVSVWRTFSAYRTLVGGRRPAGRPKLQPPVDLANQTGFQSLSRAYDDMDARANRLSAVHRSQQVFQATAMIVAVAVGSAPAVWPELKIYAVSAELALALVTFLVWLSAVKSERTRRWGEARRMAEQLRLERAAWAIGLSTRDDRRFNSTGPSAELALAWRRLAGGATGSFDDARVRGWGAWALDELIYSQIEYHRTYGHLNHRLAHRGHSIENGVFWLLVGVLVAFIGTFVATRWFGGEVPHWLGGVVILTGAIAPGFGAASLALDAALAFSEQARRSEGICRGLGAIAGALKPGVALEAIQSAARASIRLQVSQEDNWSDETAHRHVVRGG